jgi:hypothetical protein
MSTGSCLCGTVRYEIDGPFNAMVNCHCSMCRKEHGSVFVTWAVAPAEGFRWLAGEDNVGTFASSPNGARSFCRTCGSPLPTVMSGMAVVAAPAGNLEGDPGLRPQTHIFVGSRLPGFEISDDLPQFAEAPPEWGLPDVPRRPVESREGATPGSCLCGAMAWEVEGAPALMMNCHCSRCRRARGAAFATNAFYRLDQFRWLRGEAMADSYKVPDAQYFTQSFCRECGSPVPRMLEKFNRAMVPVGAFDADPGARPGAHIFVGSKADWDLITDDIPQFQEMPPRG